MDARGIKKLHEACIHGDLYTVEQIVYHHPDAFYDSIDSILRWATLGGNMKLVKYLIGIGASDYEGALISAILHGRGEIIDYLVSIGVDISKHGYSALNARCSDFSDAIDPLNILLRTKLRRCVLLIFLNRNKAIHKDIITCIIGKICKDLRYYLFFLHL